MLGSSGLFVGSMAFGTLVSENAACRLLESAASEGITAVDTAGVYGRAAGIGTAEKILGRWFGGNAHRDDWLVATKIGVRETSGEPDVRPGELRQALGRSLDRLRTEYVDILQLHFPGDPADDERICEVIAELQREGLFRSFGTCNFPLWRTERMQRWLTSAGVNYVCEQSLFNVVDHEARDAALPALRALNIGLLAYSPLAGGVLSPLDADSGARRRVGAARERRVSLQHELAQLEDLCRELSLNTVSVAIAWLRQVGASGVITGARTPRQLRQVAAAWHGVALEPSSVTAVSALFDKSIAQLPKVGARHRIVR